MNKYLILAVTVSMFVGFTAAQSDNQGLPSDLPTEAEDLPTVDNRPSTAPNNGISGGVGNALDFLPSQASDTARNVLNTVWDTPSAQIGGALQDLFDAGNETEG